MPKPHTELRFGQLVDRRKYDTAKPDETIRTALGAGGALGLAWRPAVAEGQIDRSLSAVSAAVFDVEEDGLRLVWRLDLEFRRGQRDRFTANLPAGYLLERVEGNNVRGWEIRKTDRGQTVEVALSSPPRTTSNSRCGCGAAARWGKRGWPSSTCRRSLCPMRHCTPAN